MDNHQLQQHASSQSGQLRGSRKGKITLFIVISLLILAIAIIWAIGDIGWIAGPWGKLALIFFSWAVLEIALYKAFFREGD